MHVASDSEQEPDANFVSINHPEHGMHLLTQLASETRKTMLRNHLKIAWRALLRYQGYTILNVLGLSVGIAACLLLYVVHTYESGFDKFHRHADRIYRIVRETQFPNGHIDYTGGNPLPYEDALKADMPQLGTIVPVYGTLDPQVTVLGKSSDGKNPGKKFREDHEGLLTTPAFFTLFDFAWSAGSKDVLKDPNIIVLSERKAEKYFGRWQDAVGQFVKINNKTIMKVGGILSNPPLNTDFPMDIIISYATKRRQPLLFGWGDFENWGGTSSNDQLFVLLPEKQSVAAVNAAFPAFIKKHYAGRNERSKFRQFLSPLADQHHDSRFENYTQHVTSRTVLRTIAIIGMLIIAMACINFINLSTVQAARRSKEVGVRKVLGSSRPELVRQFLTETCLVVMLSVVLGICLAMLSMPLLSKISKVPAELPVMNDVRIWLFVPLLALAVSFVAGFYPALIISGFKPVEAIKSVGGRRAAGKISLQKALIVVQFGVSQILVVGTIVTLAQMDFVRQLDLGFVKEGVYNINLDDAYKDRFQAFKNQLLQNPDFQSVSYSSDVPSSDNNWSGNFAFDNRAKDEDFHISYKFADHDYFKTYNLEFVAGGPYVAVDSVGSCVVNETLLAKAGIKNPWEAIGKNIKLGGGEWQPIVGVVRDFKTNSARDAVKPIIILKNQDFYWTAGIKIASRQMSRAVKAIEQTHAAIFPEVALQGSFLGESIEAFYQQEKQMTLLYQIFAGLSIFIACLGLFGLATFMAQQRMKEIGVRKVLGASVSGIVGLLSRDFLILVLAAIIIASPIAWYVMNEWLASFAFRIRIGWWMFASAAGGALLIAFLTVSFQSIKAALMNPVKSLKVE